MRGGTTTEACCYFLLRIKEVLSVQGHAHQSMVLIWLLKDMIMTPFTWRASLMLYNSLRRMVLRLTKGNVRSECWEVDNEQMDVCVKVSGGSLSLTLTTTHNLNASTWLSTMRTLENTLVKSSREQLYLSFAFSFSFFCYVSYYPFIWWDCTFLPVPWGFCPISSVPVTLRAKHQDKEHLLWKANRSDKFQAAP